MAPLAAAQTQDKVAVLPFMLHKEKPTDHLSLGLQEMLTARLAKKGFELVDPHAVNEGALAGIAASDEAQLKKAAGDMGIDWVIRGSLTQVGDMASLDLMIIPIRVERDPFSVFVEARTMDEVPEAMGRAAAIRQVKEACLPLIAPVA